MFGSLNRGGRGQRRPSVKLGACPVLALADLTLTDSMLVTYCFTVLRGKTAFEDLFSASSKVAASSLRATMIRSNNVMLTLPGSLYTARGQVPILTPEAP